ncbi:hypothetical protein [Anatilimnocola floriformis]|uniref:hypothetical protein n=1 Tax=Anatilimnocola floriformis TaxID=2948575 RepID=UPI0020C206EB|nr:hypothetical protein [Anatilimnocola floriformis]
MKHLLLPCALALVTTFLTGCDNKVKTYPVTGTVKFTDGKPLAGGTVEFRSVNSDVAKQVNARGEIGADGKYQLTTFNPNDGAIAGEHQVCVFPPSRDTPGNFSSEPPPSPLQRKFLAYETSGLKYTVQTTGPNVYDIDVGQKVPGSP